MAPMKRTNKATQKYASTRKLHATGSIRQTGKKINNTARARKAKNIDIIQISSSVYVPLDMVSESPKGNEDVQKIRTTSHVLEELCHSTDESPGPHKEYCSKINRLEKIVEHLTNALKVLSLAIINQSTMYPQKHAVFEPQQIDPDTILCKMHPSLAALFGHPSTNKYMIKEHTVGGTVKKDLFEAKTTDSDIGQRFPWWIPSLFKPPPGMTVDEIETKMCAYIFGAKYDDDSYGEEILIKTSNDFYGRRRNMVTLKPVGWVDEEVINLLCCMMTNTMAGNPTKCWFLPTHFAQFAIAKEKDNVSTHVDCYRTQFMGKVSALRKIFIPMNDMNSHWYLLVIDMTNKTLAILDSLPYEQRSRERKRAAKIVVMFVEDMLLDESFYDCFQDEKSVISDFPWVDNSNLPKQLYGSNDCGVYVCKWMQDCVWGTNYSIKVNTASRMRLALDLVLRPYNGIKDEIIKLTNANWDKLKDRKNQLNTNSG